MSQLSDNGKLLLLSVDMETTGYDGVEDARRFPAVVSGMRQWLSRHECSATFFCTGDVLRAYPDLVLQLVSEGHEIACHGWQHVPLERVGVDGLKKDLEAFLQCADRLGLGTIEGYRAPFFSLTAKTSWALDVLQACGFTYDSSALPASSVLYGYPAIGDLPRRLHNGLVEIPVTVWRPLPWINAGIPAFGGTYLRLMPSAMIRRLWQQQRNPAPVVAYFHPYDIDPALASVAAFSGNAVYNYLLTLGRETMLAKLDALMAHQRTMTMRQWIRKNFEGTA